MKIGFIGAGNMGSALARAVCKSVGGEQVIITDLFMDKAQAVAAELGAQAAELAQVAGSCSRIFLGVKPQMMEGMLQSIAPILKERADRYVLITMAAGLSCRRIQEMAGGSYPVIRMMPNTPCAIGAGVVQYCGLDVGLEELENFAALLAPAGLVDYVDEKFIDAASAVSGCGPAFAYLFIEALADGGVACGLPRAKAMEYAAQMLAGSAMMVLQSGKHPGELKDAVCSPGGSTIQGVRVLEQRAFRAAAIDAVIAACEKNKELGKN